MKVFYDYLVNRNNNLPLGSLENLWTATGTLLIKGSSATGNNTILNQVCSVFCAVVVCMSFFLLLLY